MPVREPTPHSRQELDARALGDFQYELWKDIEGPSADVGCAPIECPAQMYEAAGNGELTLVHRPRHPMAPPSPAQNEFQDCSFTVVHRPKISIDTTSAPVPSSSSPCSPDWVSVSPNGVKEESYADSADRGPAYGSEDEWSLL